MRWLGIVLSASVAGWLLYVFPGYMLAAGPFDAAFLPADVVRSFHWDALTLGAGAGFAVGIVLALRRSPIRVVPYRAVTVGVLPITALAWATQGQNLAAMSLGRIATTVLVSLSGIGALLVVAWRVRGHVPLGRNVRITENADGTQHYTSLQWGFTIVIPKGWHFKRLNISGSFEPVASWLWREAIGTAH